jgi:transaldolase
MKLFIDSADPKEIADCAATGLIDGVTTNPTLAAKAGLGSLERIRGTRRVYDNDDFKTEILAASIRHITHVRESALAGAGAKLKAE